MRIRKNRKQFSPRSVDLNINKCRSQYVLSQVFHGPCIEFTQGDDLANTALPDDNGLIFQPFFPGEYLFCSNDSLDRHGGKNTETRPASKHSYLTNSLFHFGMNAEDLFQVPVHDLHDQF